MSRRTAQRSHGFMAPLVGLLVGAVVLIAGTPTAQAASYGPPVTIASGFSGPYGVAVDAAGDVFVGDALHNRVVEVPAGGGLQTTLGSGLSEPMGVAVDASGDVFVADSGHSRVVEVPAGGGSQTTVGSGFSGPEVVTLDAAGDIFVADTGHSRVVEVPAGGGSQTTVGSGLSEPMGVAVDASGDVFVADTGHNRVVEVPAGGGLQTTVGSGFSQPMGVAVDSAGDVFVVDTGHGQVVEVPAGGGQQTTIVSGLSTPMGEAVDASGDVFVPDSAHGANGTGRVVEVPVMRQTATTDTVDDAATQSAWLGSETTGAAADDTATVTGAAGVASGTVSYSLYGNGGCAGTATSTDQVTLGQDGSVPASSSSGTLAAGSYGYQAAYSGDANDYPSTSALRAADGGQGLGLDSVSRGRHDRHCLGRDRDGGRDGL